MANINQFFSAIFITTGLFVAVLTKVEIVSSKISGNGCAQEWGESDRSFDLEFYGKKCHNPLSQLTVTSTPLLQPPKSRYKTKPGLYIQEHPILSSLAKNTESKKTTIEPKTILKSTPTQPQLQPPTKSKPEQKHMSKPGHKHKPKPTPPPSSPPPPSILNCRPPPPPTLVTHPPPPPPPPPLSPPPPVLLSPPPTTVTPPSPPSTPPPSTPPSILLPPPPPLLIPPPTKPVNRCLIFLGYCQDCDQNCCNEKCGAKYPGLGAQGLCTDVVGFTQRVCNCYFDCPNPPVVVLPPPLPPAQPAKRCLIPLGLCSVQNCDQKCCNEKCRAKFPTLVPEGLCTEIPGFAGSMCDCNYNC